MFKLILTNQLRILTALVYLSQDKFIQDDLNVGINDTQKFLDNLERRSKNE